MRSPPLAFSALLAAQLGDDAPAQVEDGRWLRAYVARGCPHGEPIVLSLGEAWCGPPRKLLDGIVDAPAWTHGYQLSAHGLPRLRSALKPYLGRPYELDGDQLDRLRIAVSWSGTRNAMADFGRLVRRGDRLADGRIPVVLAPAPGWDYAGVFEPLGFETAFFPLSPERGFRPDVTAVEREVGKLRVAHDRRLALVVVNAQHNPTGVDWGEPFVTALVELALEEGAALLVDDAHFAFQDPAERPTATVHLLCERLAASPRRARVPWLVTRSLGKEFDCNGWAIGALVGEPEVIDPLVRRVAQEHQYNCGGAQQWALARWLESAAADDYLAVKRAGYARNRRAILEALVNDLGYPPARVHAGDGGPFLLAPTPEAYARWPDGTTRFRRACLERTGVIFSDAWPLARITEQHSSLPYVRVFLGHPGPVVDDAFARLRDAGFAYDAELPAG